MIGMRAERKRCGHLIRLTWINRVVNELAIPDGVRAVVEDGQDGRIMRRALYSTRIAHILPGGYLQLCDVLLMPKFTSERQFQHIADTWLGSVDDHPLNDHAPCVSREDVADFLLKIAHDEAETALADERQLPLND